MSSSATPVRLRRGTCAMAFSLFCVLLSSLLLLGLSPAASAEPAGTPSATLPGELSTEGTYIVTLADAPIAAYTGDVAGYRATKPGQGEQVDVASKDAKRYRSYLRKRQDTVAARVGAKPRARHEVGLAGFTSTMTGQQAARLARTAGVLSVTKDTLRRVSDPRKSTDFLGLSGDGGVWSKLGGPGKAGRGVVVGVLDTGIWPESASFAGAPLQQAPGQRQQGSARAANQLKKSGGQFVPMLSGDVITMVKSDGRTFTGRCESGEEFSLADCNTKLIGARSFGKTWLSAVPADQRADYVSPRDGEGHGSHTASIAAGNHDVRAVVDGRDYGTISGVAPAAKIAAYKVLWQAKDATKSGAYDSDVLDAVDAAITDGVDVINYSISTDDDPSSPVQVAFLWAARAGIFVAAAAGNSGPEASTVQSVAPWLTTVGAHTIAPYYGTVTLGDDRAYAGVSSTVDQPVGPAALINGSAAAAAGASDADAAGCAADSLDPSEVAGKIVVCDRGSTGRLTKSAEVLRAGGIGMVLTNLTTDTLDADLHSVPTVHVNPPASAAIKAYAATDGATVTLTQGNQTSDTIAYPQIATFSSRGPALLTGGDTLKPDLVAPGVSILGAVAPSSNSGQSFAFESGTSQAAPQVAGLAALMYGAGLHPNWSPMMVKSALMTSAKDLRDAKGRRVSDPYAQGAGRVDPAAMLKPGLVFPAGSDDWFAYLEGLGVDTGTGVSAIDPSDYNAPSIAIGRLAGSQTVTRRVTAVQAGRYRVSTSASGLRVSVQPRVLTLKRGQTKTVKITITRTSAKLDQAASGFVTWKRKQTRIRIPVVVTPRDLDAPAQVAGSEAASQLSYTVRPGLSGRFAVTGTGLATGDPLGGPTQALPQGSNMQYAIQVPADTKAARFTARAANSQAKLNLYVFRVLPDNSTALVARSSGSAANQSLVLAEPAAGTYVAAVENAANAPGESTTVFEYRTGLAVPGSGDGAFTVKPSTSFVLAGKTYRLVARWSGLSADAPYVGWVEYPNGTGTVITVN
ncbi:MAG: S8 family serine peptidase [Microlunatus sp.]